VRAMTCLLHFYCKKNYSSVILHIACYETCQKASSSTCHYLCCFRNTFSVGSWMILTERTLKNCMCVCVCVCVRIDGVEYLSAGSRAWFIFLCCIDCCVYKETPAFIHETELPQPPTHTHTHTHTHTLS